MERETQIVSKTNAATFVFYFGADNHRGLYDLAVVCEDMDHDTEIGVALKLADPVIGKRHAVRACRIGIGRPKAIETACAGLAQWIEETRGRIGCSEYPTLQPGWDVYDYGNTLKRERDGASFPAPQDAKTWRALIEDFEFREGHQWTPEQIAAMQQTVEANKCHVGPDGHQWANTFSGHMTCLQCGIPAYGNERGRGVLGAEARKMLDIRASLPGQTFSEALYKQVKNNSLLTALSASEDRLIQWSNPSDPTSWGSMFDKRIAELQADDPSLTTDMIVAGVGAMLAYEGDDAGEVATVWKAMGALSPVPRMMEQLRTENADRMRRIILLEAHLKRQATLLGDAANELAALNAERNALRDALAKIITAPALDAEAPKPNPFREFPSDPRRLGA